jgi:phage gp36-like protein
LTVASYASLAQLHALGVNAEALAHVAEADQQEALEAASCLVDTYLWKLNPPLAVFTGEISEAVAVIAAYTIMSSRGFDPEHDDSKNLRLRYLDKIRWLESLDGGAKLPGAVGQGSGSTAMLGPRVSAAPLRGWDRGWRGRRPS